MPKPFTQWKVLRHDSLIALEDNILTVTGDIPMPVGGMQRRMTIVRLNDGRLVIFSAMALAEDAMRQIEAFGVPAFMIVPDDHHCLDAGPWKARYPALQVITPAAAREKVEQAVHVDATSADFGDPDVTLITVPGTRDAALQVAGPGGVTLILNDLIGNIRGATGFGGWALRAMGFAGDAPHIPGPIKAAIVADKPALADQLRRWAELPGLKRIVVSHGEIIHTDPAAALTALAELL